VSIGTVRLETAGSVARIILNNPARHNAMSLAMWRLLPEVVSAAVSDRRVRVIAVSGAGEKAFCAGADISEFGTNRADPDAAAAYNEAVKVGLTALKNAEKPTVAQIRGICFGGGLEIALCCDLRVASSGARFRIPAARLGLGYGYDDVSLLVERLGVDATAEILFTAAIIAANQALARGIVHTVFADEGFTEEAEKYLGTIAANAPLVLKAVKRALIELEKPKHEREVAAVETAAAACIESRDYLEGQTAFRERREPRFTGE